MDKFTSTKQVLDYLLASGYKVSKSTLYDHVKTGFLRSEPGGDYLKAQVDTYAKANLKRIDGTLVKQGDELGRLTLKEKRLQVEKLELANQKVKEEIQRERERWVPRDELDSELAGRVCVLDNGLRHFFWSKAAAMVAVVGGDPMKIDRLVDFMNQELDTQLTAFASTENYQVIVTDNANN
ncbi:MAG: hypothetical protein C0591_05430 [Marinilabiliales bacterium]|nr:MAG: hypothetical protein C0591_05430 [Marinilabiliales bacterium]